MTAPVLIFGATGGVGSALARRLAAQGATLHLAGRDDAALAALAAETRAAFSRCDVLDDGALAAAVAAAGPMLSGFVFAVGSIVLKPLRQIVADEMMATYRLNVVAAAQAIRHAAPALAAAGGAVVLFSSVAARRGFSGHTAIGPAKAAVEGLTVSLAAELAPKVRVNCIAPSLMRTKMAAGLTGSEALTRGIAQQHALKRLGEADDAAALAAFLLSSDAGWMSGQIVGLDGGRARLST